MPPCALISRIASWAPQSKPLTHGPVSPVNGMIPPIDVGFDGDVKFVVDKIDVNQGCAPGREANGFLLLPPVLLSSLLHAAKAASRGTERQGQGKGPIEAEGA